MSKTIVRNLAQCFYKLIPINVEFIKVRNREQLGNEKWAACKVLYRVLFYSDRQLIKG